MHVGAWAVALLAAGAAATGCGDTACVATFAKCGGKRLAGQPRTCCSPEDSCVEKNDFYAQCMPDTRAAVKVSEEGWTGTVLVCGNATAPADATTAKPNPVVPGKPVDPGLPGPDAAVACCCSVTEPCEDASVCAAVTCAAPGTGDGLYEGHTDYGDYTDYGGTPIEGESGIEGGTEGALGGGLVVQDECCCSETDPCDDFGVCASVLCPARVRGPECSGGDTSTCGDLGCLAPEVSVCGNGFCYCACPNLSDYLYCSGPSSEECECVPLDTECSDGDTSTCGFACPGAQVPTCNFGFCSCGCPNPDEELVCNGDGCACGIREPECTLEDTSTCLGDCLSPGKRACFDGYCTCECPKLGDLLYCEPDESCDCFPVFDECSDGDASTCGIKCFEPEVRACEDGNCTCKCPNPGELVYCDETGCSCTSDDPAACAGDDASGCKVTCFEGEVRVCEDGRCTCACAVPTDVIGCSAEGCVCMDASEPECTAGDASTCTYPCPEPMVNSCRYEFCSCECPDPEQDFDCIGINCGCFDKTQLYGSAKDAGPAK